MLLMSSTIPPMFWLLLLFGHFKGFAFGANSAWAFKQSILKLITLPGRPGFIWLFFPWPSPPRAVMWLIHVKLWDRFSLKNQVKSPFFKNCHWNIICEPAAQNFTSPIWSFPEWKLGLLLKPCIDLIQKQDKQASTPLVYNSSLGVLTVQPIIIIKKNV